MTLYIHFTVIGADAGPFRLYSDVDGYTSPFEINITSSQLLSGFSSAGVPDGTTIVRAISIGVCSNFIDMPVGSDPVVTTTTTTGVPTTTTTTTGIPITTTTSTTLIPPTTTTTTTYVPLTVYAYNFSAFWSDQVFSCGVDTYGETLYTTDEYVNPGVTKMYTDPFLSVVAAYDKWGRLISTDSSSVLNFSYHLNFDGIVDTIVDCII